jgi:hypothetical protein
MSLLIGNNKKRLGQNRLVKDLIKTTINNFPFLRQCKIDSRKDVSLDYLTGNLSLHDIACYEETSEFCWSKNQKKVYNIELLRKIKADVDIDTSAHYYLIMMNWVNRWKL